MSQTLRQIVPHFLEFWVWQPVIDRIRVCNDDGGLVGFTNDYTHYDFRGKWVIAMRSEDSADSFFLPDIDFFMDLDDIGDCLAVGIKRPPSPDAITKKPTALHGLATHDLVDILTNAEFSVEEKEIATEIVNDRFYALQTKFSNLSRRAGIE